MSLRMDEEGEGGPRADRWWHCSAFPCSHRAPSTHLLTPPKARSTMKAEILSFSSPVVTFFMRVLANTVKISAVPPLLEGR